MSDLPDTGRRPDTTRRLDALARPDKWYLAAGEGVLWAPPFPEHLDRPGFWDEAHVFHFAVRPLFTVALVDVRGREIELRPMDRHWRPDRLLVRWRAGGKVDGPVLVEERAVLPGARFGSVWTIDDEAGWAHPALEGAWLTAFTQIPEEDGGVDGGVPGGVAWSRHVTARHLGGGDHTGTELGFDLVAGADTVARRALRSEGRETPQWSLTPFPELWRPGAEPGLGDDLELRGLEGRGRIHVAVAVPLAAVAADAALPFTLRVRTRGFLEPDGAAADASPPHATPGEGEAVWARALEGFPRFRCSDRWLTRYWDYRIYGLTLNRLAPGPDGYPHPAVAEGIEYFHWPISYSAQCHMMESRWAADPGVARGSLLNFLAAQREDGSLPGRLHLCPDAAPEPDFYHASWGDALLAVDALHPDDGFLAEAYVGLSRYARWLMEARDPEGSGMVTVVNHYETGQEYMSRYVAVDPDADTTEWEPRLALKGIDVTVYLQRLQRALVVVARRLGRESEAARWEGDAVRTAGAVMGTMWDDAAGLFGDVASGTMERTGVKAAVCFYPLLTDLLEDRHVESLLAHLTDPDAFWTPWPVPSSSVDDPLFDPDGLWKGKRHNCPWNGRVWPMTNSHVVEGLLRQWRAGRRDAGPVAADLLARFVRMMFDDQDPDRPNCFEHYNPYTAHPSRFRGIDDYQHSWVLDLIARGVAGVDPDTWFGGGTPEEAGATGGGEAATDGDDPRTRPLVVDPLPLGLEEVDLEGAVIRGRRVDVRIRRDVVAVTVDGVEHWGTVGTPLEIG